MNANYDAGLDVRRILLSAAPIAERDDGKPGVMLDYAQDGSVVDEVSTKA